MKEITISFSVSIAFNQFDSVIRVSLQSDEYLRMGFEIPGARGGYQIFSNPPYPSFRKGGEKQRWVKGCLILLSTSVLHGQHIW